MDAEFAGTTGESSFRRLMAPRALFRCLSHQREFVLGFAGALEMQCVDDIGGIQDTLICHGIVAFADLGDSLLALKVPRYRLQEAVVQCVELGKNLDIHMVRKMQGRRGRCMPKIVGLMKEQRWNSSLTNEQPSVLANVLFGEPLNHQGIGSKSRPLIVVKVELLATCAEDNGAEPCAFENTLPKRSQRRVVRVQQGGLIDVSHNPGSKERRRR